MTDEGVCPMEVEGTFLSTRNDCQRAEHLLICTDQEFLGNFIRTH